MGPSETKETLAPRREIAPASAAGGTAVRIQERRNAMTQKQKKMLIRILITAAMLVALYIIPVTGWLRLALYLPCLLYTSRCV